MENQPVSEHDPDKQGESSPAAVSDATAWAMIATLVAGPATWGGIGWLIDRLLDAGRSFTLIGVVVGFVTSIYVVYVRYRNMSGGAGEGR